MPPTGPQSKTYLFVAVLPYSGLIYCQAFLNMKTPAWLEAHIAAFAYFGGVVQIVVPDNPTTSTHRRTRGDGERVINARYQDMADHYGVAIVPARVKKPRDKAAVENAVNVVNKRVIGYLDAEVFETLDELRGAIAERVYEINYELVRADDTTRIQRFDTEEAHLLAPLPDARFEEVEWKQAKVGRNYHVRADYQHYSVPYQLAGQILRVRLTATRVTIFNGSELVCEHRRRTGRKGQYSTLAEHVPIQHHNIDGL
ncbi:Mu transposase domain-containing protein [Brevibacterium epidermidis]|uniref:Mu transposase domain-containing protein n=1 Tax=Brevibacterium epidermidis TaxID=1698 RepID=UPI000BF9F7D9|nr:DDE-type integrase/transposase/recombinase [Brevibacterium epidermidis]